MKSSIFRERTELLFIHMILHKRWEIYFSNTSRTTLVSLYDENDTAMVETQKLVLIFF